MLYHPAIYTLIANILLIRTFKYNKLFKSLAIIYPMGCIAVLCLSDGITTFEVFGIKFLLDYQINNKLLGIAFLISSLAINLYAIGQERKFEIIIGGFYLSFTLICLFAGDLISMFIALELMIIPATILILSSESKNNISAAKQYFLTHLFSGSLILVGICYFIHQVGNSEIANVLSLFYATKQSIFMYSCLLIGCLINIAAFPASDWMINCYPKSTSSGFLYLITFTTKISIVIILKLFQGLDILKYFGIIMMLYGGIYACIENNIRRLLCYLSISQLGFILTIISASSTETIPNIILYLIIHIIYKLMLGSYAATMSDYLQINDCDRVTSVTSLHLNFVLMLGCLMLVNFPFTASFIAKTYLLAYIYDYSILYLQQFINIIVFIVLPLKHIVRNKYSHRIQINNFILASLLILPILLLILNFYLLEEYNSFWSDKSYALLKDLLKQTGIVIIGLMLGFFISFPRKDTRNFSFDLVIIIVNYGNKLLNSYKKFKNAPKESYELNLIEDKTLKNLKAIHTQSVAIGIIFLILVILILTHVTN